MSKIEMNKTYRTRDGRHGRILCVDFKNYGYTVIAAITEPNGIERLTCLQSNGRECLDPNELAENDLIEYNQFSELKIDDKILVNDGNNNWKKYHFDSYSDGYVSFFPNGRTSFTKDEPSRVLPEYMVKIYDPKGK